MTKATLKKIDIEKITCELIFNSNLKHRVYDVLKTA